MSFVNINSHLLSKISFIFPNCFSSEKPETIKSFKINLMILYDSKFHIYFCKLLRGRIKNISRTKQLFTRNWVVSNKKQNNFLEVTITEIR